MTSVRSVLIGVIIFLLHGVSSVIVDTENGSLNGTIIQTWTGKNVYAFFGIPFAQPPIFNLRFQPPKPVESWNGVRPAIEYGPICWQARQENMPDMDEDCLTLNVFTKNLPLSPETELKPVIVFIHGGGLYAASASLEAGPLYLSDRDIVYVSMNYRLGALGFLSTGTVDSLGNMGMKDQVMALRWIKTNIRNFGGNPERVTYNFFISSITC